YIISAYLGGLLRYIFKDPESTSLNGDASSTGVDGAEKTRPGKIHAHWTGIMGFSADMLPFVGLMSAAITGRQPSPGTSGAQEWVAAGFTGEGMVNAWGCGVALACMVRERLDIENDEIQCDMQKKEQLNQASEVEERVPSQVEDGLDPQRWKEWFPKEYLVS